MRSRLINFSIERKRYKYIIQWSVATALLFSLSCSPVFAASLDDYYKQRDYYSAVADAAKKAREQKEKDAAAVKDQINQVSTQIGEAENALKGTEEQLTSTQQIIDDLEDQIKAEEENLSNEKEKLGHVVSSLYMEGEYGLIASVVGSENISEFVTKQQYYETIQQQIQATVGRINTLKDALGSEKNEKDRQLVNLQDMQKNQEQQKNTLERQKQMKDRLLNDTQRAITELKEEEKQAASKEQQALSEISRLISSRSKTWFSQKGKGQRVNAGDVIGTMGSTGNSTGAHLHFEVHPNGDGQTADPQKYIGSTFVWPTVSHRVTQGYGMTSYARAGAYGGNIHTGLDVGAVTPGVWGDPILAAGPGEIVFKDWNGAYGYAVVIAHDNGMITLYAHLGTAN